MFVSLLALTAQYNSEHGPGSEINLCLRLTSLYVDFEEGLIELGCVPLFEDLSDPNNPGLRLGKAASSLQLSKAPYGMHTLKMNAVVSVRDSFGIESSILGPGASLEISVAAVPSTGSFRPRSSSDRATCALRGRKRGVATSGSSPPRGDEGQAESLTICVLVSRGRRSFARAFSSWNAAGVVDRASQVLVFLQEWPYSDSEPRHHAEVSKDDERIRNLALDPRLNITVTGSPSQLNIAPAMVSLFEMASPLSRVLFLEEDFFIDQDAVSGVLARERIDDGLRL